MLNKYIKLNIKYKFYISFSGGKAIYCCKPPKIHKLNISFCKIISYLERKIPIRIGEILSDYLSKINKNSTKNITILKNTLIDLQNIGLLSFVNIPIPNNNIYGSITSYYPQKISIELTNNCNSACIHCYFKPSKSKIINIDSEKLISKLTFLKDRGLYQIELTGGEPLTHPDFFKILFFSLENFQFVSIMTNGILINENLIKKLNKIDKEKKHHIFFSISLDTNIKKMYKTIRGINEFERVTNGIKLLRKNNFFVRATMTIFPDINITNIYDTFKFATEELDVNDFAYTPVIPFGKAINPWNSSNISYSIKVITEQENLIKIKKKYSKRLEIRPKTNLNKVKNCGAGHKKVAISYTGNIKPCVLFPENFVVLGNIFKDELDSIFNYNNLKDFIEIIPPNKNICYDCNNLQMFCQGCILNGLVSFNSSVSCKWVEQTPQSFIEKFNFKHCDKV